MTNNTWQTNLIYDSSGIWAILRETRRIAVLGIKTEAQSGQAAFYVPAYLASVGFEVVPVPVYYPNAPLILDQPVFRTLASIPEPVDLVNIFRRPDDIPAHIDDILAARPKAVWMQSGIENAEVAESLAKAGIRVVQNRCIMVEHRNFCDQPSVSKPGKA